MNSPTAHSPGSAALLCSLFAALVTTAAAAAAKPAPPAAPERPDATHTLFMGSDISVEWKGAMYPVQHVQGSSFIIKADGKRVVVPTSNTSLKLKLEDNLKLTPTAATVTNLKADRAYTTANDPTQKLAQMVSLTMSQMAEEDLALRSLRQADTNNGIAQAAAAVADPRDTGAREMAAFTASQAAAAAGNFAQTVDRGFSSFNDVGTHVNRMGTELMQEQFDALRLSFDVSSAQPLGEPYMVVVARFLENPEDPKSVRQLVYAQELSPIGPKPHTIQLFRGGFPPGYVLQEYRVHLYDHGNEVATTVARKRVALTADEAFQYSVVDYLTQNRDKNAAATPAKAFWPANLRSRLAATGAKEVVYVKVGKDGKPTGAFEDENCSHALSEGEIKAALADLRFFPAMNKGKAAEGVVPVRLAQQ